MERAFYGVDEPLSLRMSIILGLQHVLALFVGVITPPLIVASALHLSPDHTTLLVSMSLFTSGLNSMLQVSRVGPFGSGLLSLQGPSFVFVPLAIQSAQYGGLSLVFGLSLAGAVVPMLVSVFLGRVRSLFPPVVTGTAIALIGFSLIGVGFKQMAGGPGSADFGSAANWGLGIFVVVVIVTAQVLARGVWRTVTIALGLGAGFLLSLFLGRVDMTPVGQAPWVHIPSFSPFGLSFDGRHLFPWLVGYLLVALECIGDLTATSAVSRQPVQGPLFERRVRGGLLADGLGCMVTSLLSAMPKTTFAQNNGVIALTGVASRRAGVAAAAILIALGLFPKLAALISAMPRPVIGGATLLMFATVAVGGLQIVASGGLGARKHFILSVSLGIGMGIILAPEALKPLQLAVEQNLPPFLAGSVSVLLESGMAAGTLAAALLNLVLPQWDDDPQVDFHALATNEEEES